MVVHFSDIAGSRGVLNGDVRELEEVFEVVEGEFSVKVDAGVKSDGVLLGGIVVFGAVKSEVELEATSGVVSDNKTVDSVHGNGLCIAFVGEGKDSFASGVGTIVSLDLGHEDKELVHGSIARKGQFHAVHEGVDHGLVDVDLKGRV